MDDLERLVTSIGALAEVTAMYYNGLINHGIEHEDAMRLTEVFISTTLEANK